MDASAFRAWIAEAARLITDNAERLTDLDAAIGDGDHGINLRRGFQAAAAATADAATPAAVLQAVGRALISKTGGASGPLYGTAFRQAAKSLGDATEVSADELAAALAAALAGVQELGGAAVGDKTMVDALSPAVAAFQSTDGLATAARAAVDAATRGAQSTVDLTARKGRASYLAERSAGHEDPGAASTVLILTALATVTAG